MPTHEPYGNLIDEARKAEGVAIQIFSAAAMQDPNITIKRDGPADGKEFDGKAGKFDAFFSAEPGEGD